jgi:O-antigen ligase
VNHDWRLWLRTGLAVCRLALLYGMLCWLLLAAGLAGRSLPAEDLHRAPAAPVALPFRGVTAELDALPAAERRDRLATLHADGYGWLRHRFDWGKLEPQPGQFEWAGADALLADIAAAGLEPLVVLDGSPAWARAAHDRAPTDNPLAPPADPAAFARFAAGFAARYGAHVRFYQIWDEPNVAPHWGNQLIEPVAYAQLLKQASAAIRAVDGDAQLITAALAPTVDRGHLAIDEPYFLQRMIAAGAAPAFDLVAVQSFGFGHSPASPRQATDLLNFQRAALIRRTLVAAGLADKPLLATRFGWNRRAPSPWGSVTAADQARYAGAALDLGWRDWPWLAGMGWAVERPDAPPAAPVWGFALVEPDGTPTQLSRVLAGWQPAGARGVEAAPALRAVTTPWGEEAPAWLILLLIVAGSGLLGWRGWAAARILPWPRLIAAYRRAPHGLHIASRGALLLAYYFVTWPPLIGLTWLGWVLLALAQPQIGLGLAAALLPFYFQHKEVGWVDVTLAAPPATVAVACLLPAILVAARQSRRRPAAVDWVALALPGVSLLAAVNVWHWPAYWHGLATLVLTPLGLWFGVRVLARDERTLLRLALWLVAGGLVVAVWGLATWLLGAGVVVDGVRRLVGPHFSPNHTALYLERTFFVALGLALAAPRRRRLWALALCGVVLVALLLTGSRGALLGLGAGAAVMTLLALRRRPALGRWLRLRRAPLLWIGAAAGVALALLVSALWERLLNWQTVLLRGELWRAALALWQAHPWVGVGPGGFFWRYPAFLPPGPVIEANQLHPHNLWLELATTWGVLGLVWCGLLLWVTLRTRRRGVTHSAPAYWLAAGLVAGVTAGVVHGQTDAFFLLADIAGWNALAWAMLIQLDRFAAIPRRKLQS